MRFNFEKIAELIVLKIIKIYKKVSKILLV